MTTLPTSSTSATTGNLADLTGTFQDAKTLYTALSTLLGTDTQAITRCGQSSLTIRRRTFAPSVFTVYTSCPERGDIHYVTPQEVKRSALLTTRHENFYVVPFAERTVTPSEALQSLKLLLAFWMSQALSLERALRKQNDT
jgi:hypothetical protein